MSRWLVATMTSVLCIALVIAVTGFEYLLIDLRVITQPDATPYLGPAMVVSVAVVVFLAVGVGAPRGNPGVTGLVTAAAAYLVMLGVGAVGYALVHGDATQLLVFPAGYALGPFVVGTVLVALLCTVGGIALARQQDRAAGRTTGTPTPTDARDQPLQHPGPPQQRRDGTAH